ncbi:LysR substrate-binding domain-containing protein [Marinobacterium weihaiense]|uniref:LysR family transcriptional regulator n=1 Tax=Marinobacterium weihaiense TaxID=2851016 RepID=A0ABS6MBN6_9GAMM|nr:LysR substrate-binding domain-containing protein [Marinobacterium weihaiense]MBV0933718.1 LysR family transcriptional regulator [Marinobacterium weihaiense]
MTQPNLSTELLRTFTTVVDEGGFIRAAERLHKTQSTISQQVRRLEQELGVALFRSEGRKRVLTPTGETMLGYARQMLSLQEDALAAITEQSTEGELRIGVSLSLTESLLPSILARFKRHNPGIRLNVQTDYSNSVCEDYDNDAYDLALILRRDRSQIKGELLGYEPLVWIGASGYQWSRNQPLPLVLLNVPCLFREATLQALDATDISWRTLYSTTSFTSLMAAVRAELGVTVRTQGALAEGLESIGSRLGLPELPPVYIELRYRPHRAGCEPLAQLIRHEPLQAW